MKLKIELQYVELSESYFRIQYTFSIPQNQALLDALYPEPDKNSDNL